MRNRILAGLAFALLTITACTACSSTTSEEAPPPAAPGGPMTVPVGTKCTGDGECGGECADGGCLPASAIDGVKNGDETDIDCGGVVAARCADGKGCVAAPDCASKTCIAGTCTAPSPTDGIANGDETDVDCGGTKAPGCPTGGLCNGGADCASGVCGPDKKCVDPKSSDGVKNGTETDVDCGGGAPTNASVCPAGKTCAVDVDCFWGHCNGGVCGGHAPGTKDGDQTDIDCGGTQSPECDWFKKCLVDGDCTSGACSSDKQCLPGPSCKGIVHGGTTCGTGEFPDASKNHETCCRSLPVSGYADPNQAGKTVYLDKYEITAGRMREFIAQMAAANGGVPDIKAYMAAHRPARWNPGWENVLPQAFGNASNATYTVSSPTDTNPAPPHVGLLYPGQDLYATTQKLVSWSDVSGTYTVYTGTNYVIGLAAMFPEFVASSGDPTYAWSHAYNCSTTAGSYGFPTYWLDAATMAAVGADIGVTVGARAYTKDQLDEKALNCTPNAVFAAFCAWDGGQLATSEVLDYVLGGGRSAGLPGSDCNGLNIRADSGGACSALPSYYPFTGTSADDAARIGAPGRIAADSIRINAGDEPWMDLKGNLIEIAMRPNNATFETKSYGVGYNSSVAYHALQTSTPRGKTAEYGARCMRFK